MLELLETHPGPLLVPTLVIAEVAYLLETRLGVEPEVRFLADLAEGNLIAEPVMLRAHTTLSSSMFDHGAERVTSTIVSGASPGLR